MNIKKFVLILIFFSLANCGFQPMYSQKDRVNFQIKGIELIGDKHVNRKIIDSFTYNNNSNKFELAQYQKNIEKNLTNKIAEEIIVFLNY